MATRSKFSVTTNLLHGIRSGMGDIGAQSLKWSVTSNTNFRCRDDIQQQLSKFELPEKYVNKAPVSRHNSNGNSFPGPQSKNKKVSHPSEPDRQKSKVSVAGDKGIARLHAQLWGEVSFIYLSMRIMFRLSYLDGQEPLSPFPKEVLFSHANSAFCIRFATLYSHL